MEEKIAINGYIDLKLERFGDLIRLQNDFERLVEKYAKVLADNSYSCEAVVVLLRNVETLQVAIGDIHGQSINFMNFSDGSDVSKIVKNISNDMKKLQKFCPLSRLN